MTKYTVAAQRRARAEARTLPPIWRGIGCLLILFFPIVSYILAAWIIGIAVANNWPMPYQLMGFPVMPAILSNSPDLVPLINFIEAQNNLYAILLVTLLLVVALGTLMSLIYSVIYKFVGPPQYGSLDAPPPKVAPRSYKR